MNRIAVAGEPGLLVLLSSELPKTIIAARNKLTQALDALRFDVLPSQINLILVRPARGWLQNSRDQKTAMRWFDAPGRGISEEEADSGISSRGV